MNPIEMVAIFLGAFMICRGLDAFATDARIAVMVRLGYYQKCEDCRGLGILRTEKKLFKWRKH
jgi:hypothetical protein